MCSQMTEPVAGAGGGGQRQLRLHGAKDAAGRVHGTGWEVRHHPAGARPIERASGALGGGAALCLCPACRVGNPVPLACAGGDPFLRVVPVRVS